MHNEQVIVADERVAKRERENRTWSAEGGAELTAYTYRHDQL